MFKKIKDLFKLIRKIGDYLFLNFFRLFVLEILDFWAVLYYFILPFVIGFCVLCIMAVIWYLAKISSFWLFLLLLMFVFCVVERYVSFKEKHFYKKANLKYSYDEFINEDISKKEERRVLFSFGKEILRILILLWLCYCAIKLSILVFYFLVFF